MTAAIDITAGQRKTLLALLRRYIPGVAVWAYGSRVKWTARPNSDLDLVAFTTPEQQPLVSELKEALAESDLPFLVDFHVWDDVPERFHEIIRKEYAVLQEAKHSEIGLGTSGGGFKACMLGDIAEFRNGKALSPDMYVSFGQHPVFGSNGQIARTNEVLTKEPLVVIGRVGAYCGSVHHVDEPAWVSDNAIIATGKNQTDVRFLYYLLGSLDLRRTAIGSAQPLMTQGGLKVVPAIAPPPPEQKAIAHILGTLDDKIELNRRMNATLEAMVLALFQSWFVDFDPVRANLDGRQPAGLDTATAALFPAHFQESPLGHIPQGWEVKTADDVSIVGIGKTPPRKEHHWFSEEPSDVPWISIRDLGEAGVFISHTSEFLTTEAVEKFRVKRIPDDTVVLSFKLTMGRVAITDGEMLSNEAIAHFRLKPETSFGSAYLYCYLKGFGYDQLGSTSSIATAINSDMVRGIRVLVPPKPIAEAFERTVKPLFTQMKITQMQSRTLATIRDTLLPKLLSGELRVSEADFSVEVYA